MAFCEDIVKNAEVLILDKERKRANRSGDTVYRGIDHGMD